MHELIIPTAESVDCRETSVELIGRRISNALNHVQSGQLAAVVVSSPDAIAEIRDWCTQTRNVFAGFWNNEGTIHALVRRP